MGYVHKEISNPFIIVQKDEGIQPTAKLLHFLFTLSKSLSHNHKYCLQCYNTIHNHVTILSFIGEKYHGKIPRLTQYHGSAKLLSNKHPRTPKQGEWVFSTPGLQSQLNNISGYGILGSTTNKRCIYFLMPRPNEEHLVVFPWWVSMLHVVYMCECWIA